MSEAFSLGVLGIAVRDNSFIVKATSLRYDNQKIVELVGLGAILDKIQNEAQDEKDNSNDDSSGSESNLVVFVDESEDEDDTTEPPLKPKEASSKLSNVSQKSGQSISLSLDQLNVFAEENTLIKIASENLEAIMVFAQGIFCLNKL